MTSYLKNPFAKGPPPKTKATMGDRLGNIVNNNFRGLIGTGVALAVILPLWEKDNELEMSVAVTRVWICAQSMTEQINENVRKLEIMWGWLFWFYLWQPVAVPNTSLIPVFYLPMVGVLDSVATCKCYVNETVMLFVLTSWLIVLLNNSGVDKRIALWFIASGDNSQYSGKKLVYKTSTAAFFLSMFSSRLIATLNLTEYVTKACGKADPSGKSGDVQNVRYAVNSAIHTSASIGGIAILHSSYVTLLFRGCFHEYIEANTEWPDIFNYFTYSVFAFPVALVMLIVNIIYHTVLIGKVSKGLSEPQRKEIQAAFERNKAEIPKAISLHEKFSVLFLLLLLVALFLRWVPIMDGGWAKFSVKYEPLPGVKDATVGAIFVILLHSIPKSFGFTKIFSAQKKSQLALKPESAILWWRFVDKNCNYGYIFTFGAAFALLIASRIVHMDHEISEAMLGLTNLDFNIGLLVAVVVAAFLCNIMTAMAACSVWLPFIMCMSVDAPFPWPTKVYLAALGVGIASNFGFCTPFQYTPSYYCHHSGKVPIEKMRKISIIPVLYCTIILYVALAFVAEMVWDSSKAGFVVVTLPSGKTTTTTTTTTTTETPPPP